MLTVPKSVSIMIQRLNPNRAGGTIDPNSLLGNNSHGLNGLFLKLCAGNKDVVVDQRDRKFVPV